MYSGSRSPWARNSNTSLRGRLIVISASVWIAMRAPYGPRLAMSKFERDTTVTEVEPGVYEGQVNRDWWIVFGPNGGFLAAMMVKAMGAAVADDTRAARSLTIHYTAAPKEGPIRVRTTIERAGRSLTTISARMEQGERLIA